MKSSDLRIGNIVAVCYEDVVTPDTVLLLEPGLVHLSKRKYADSDRDIIGVPLHEKWLRKFKFRYNFHSDKWTLNKIIIKKAENERTNMWLIQCEKFKLKIEFVHQLQDVLRY